MRKRDHGLPRVVYLSRRGDELVASADIWDAMDDDGAEPIGRYVLSQVLDARLLDIIDDD